MHVASQNRRSCQAAQRQRHEPPIADGAKYFQRLLHGLFALIEAAQSDQRRSACALRSGCAFDITEFPVCVQRFVRCN